MGRPRHIFSVKHGWYHDTGEKPQSHGIVGAAMAPIENPLTGRICDDRNDYMREIEKASERDGVKYKILGDDCVGRWQKEVGGRKSPPIKYEQWRDAHEYARSVVSDRTKLNAWRNEQNERRAEYRDAGLGDD